MALTSISVIVNNNPYAGCIDFNITSNINTLGNIETLEIYRKKQGVLGIGSKIYSKTLSDISDLDFNYSDICNKSKMNYTYTVQLVSSSSVLEYQEYNVQSWFDGLFIGNYVNQYVAPLNCNTAYKQNTESSYVTTLAARTPYKVSNSNANYATGTSSAMFLELDSNNNPIPDITGEYTKEVVAFLTDGSEKILKTSSGEIWLVAVDKDVEIDPNDNYEGARMLSFDWTEVNDVPVLRTV